MNILILTANHAYSFIIQAKALAKGFEKLGIKHSLQTVNTYEESKHVLEQTKPSHVISIGNWTDYDILIKAAFEGNYKNFPWIVNDDYTTFRPLDEYRQLPLILTPSEHCKENFIRNNVDGNKIVVIPEAVDPDIWQPYDEAHINAFIDLISVPINTGAFINKFDLSISKSVPIIFTTGGEASKKGAQEVIQALAMLNKSIPWIYLIKTWPSPLTFQKSIEELELAEKLGITDRVRYIVGEYSESFMVNIMNMSAIYAAPSRHEGFGLPHVEAQMCGKPAIGMHGTSTAETIIDGKTGFLAEQDPTAPNDFPKADIKSLAGGLEKILTDHTYRQTLGKNALIHAHKNFAPEIIARRFYDEYISE